MPTLIATPTNILRCVTSFQCQRMPNKISHKQKLNIRDTFHAIKTSLKRKHSSKTLRQRTFLSQMHACVDLLELHSRGFQQIITGCTKDVLEVSENVSCNGITRREAPTRPDVTLFMLVLSPSGLRVPSITLDLMHPLSHRVIFRSSAASTATNQSQQYIANVAQCQLE